MTTRVSLEVDLRLDAHTGGGKVAAIQIALMAVGKSQPPGDRGTRGRQASAQSGTVSQRFERPIEPFQAQWW